MLDRYSSNEWIDPIVMDARPIFEEFPEGTAVEVASAVLKSVDIGTTEIPWTTVFPSDNISQIASSLLKVLQTPDYSTPAYNQDTHLAVEELIHLLERHDAVGMLGAHAAYHLVQAAAGKEDELFRTYQDLSRRWPQYSSAWADDITRQFGEGGYVGIVGANQELSELLGSIEIASELHYQNSDTIEQPGESTTDLIARTLDFFDLSTAEGLAEASRILGRGFDGYRRLAYQIRGLPEPTE